MKYDTVVFDLDGTLLDTLEDLKNATNYALAHHGYPVRTQQEVRRFVGNGVQKLMERALPQEVPPEQFALVFDSFKEYYGAHCEDTTRVYDGVPELLGKLRESGFCLAIVSNKLDSAVRELHAAWFGDSVQVAIGEREGIRRKPAPDMVLEALSRLGSSAERAVYVGDSDVDIQTAANSGLDCISVSWGFRDVEFLKAHGARLIADTPQQVYELLMHA